MAVYPAMKIPDPESDRIRPESQQVWRGGDEAGEVKKQRAEGCCPSGQCIPVGSLSTTGVGIILSGKAWWFRRVIWAVIVSAFATIMIIQLQVFVIKFAKNMVEREFSQQILTRSPIPAITICHNNKFKKSVVEAMSVPNTTMTDWLFRPEFSQLDWDQYTLEDLIASGSYTWDDMVFSCFIEGYSCMDMGSIKYATYTQKLGMCYTYQTNATVTESLLDGQIGVLFYEPENVGQFEHGGWTVVIHDQHTPFNDITLIGGVALPITILPNSSIQVKVTAKKSQYEPVAGINGTLSCHPHEAVETTECMSTCLQALANYTDNDCRLPWVKTLANHTSCSSFEQLQRSSRRTDIGQIEYDGSLYETTRSCGCQLPCKYNSYMLSVPYRHTLLELRQMRIIEGEILGTVGHASLWIQNTVQIIRESRPYQWSQFSSDLGGTLGLMLGGSLLTIVELIDWLICSVCGLTLRGTR